jgi:predicted sulfurtransferase
VGTFEGAVPLNTTFFRESWPVLDALLRDTPRDAPLLTFCTGGIRCVKVNAYLQQRLGFTNTHRLAGGIIAYDRWLAEQNQNQGREHKEAHEASSIKPVSELPPEDSRQLMDTSAGRVGKVRGAVEDVSDTQQQGSADAAGQVRSRFLGRNFLFDRRRLGYNTMEA